MNMKLNVSGLALMMVLGACATSVPVSEAAPADTEVAETVVEEAGPMMGPDMELEAISPESTAVDVGLAGSDPANIARYLLASGAGGAGISPDGETIAFRWSITGKPQLWTVPAAGGSPTS